jgi:hypothetical protein
MKNKMVGMIGAIAILALVLTACNLPGSSSATSTQGTEATSAVEATNAPTEAPATNAAPGACLVGTWSLTDFAPYMDSIKQNLSTQSNNNFTFTSGDFSGSATFVFNADNTTSLKMDNFVQSFTMSMTVSDNTIDIPVTLTVNGNSGAKYSTEGDQITFSDQDPGDMQVTIDTNGTASTMDQSMFGDPGTQKLYQYSCVDANTLSLKVIAVESMDLAPLILTRVP